MLLNKLNRRRRPIRYSQKEEDVDNGFFIKVALGTSFFFLGNIVIYLFFSETFISFFQLITTYLFISFIVLVLFFFYKRSKKQYLQTETSIFIFGVLAPVFVALYLATNFYFSTFYASQTFQIPSDFVIKPITEKNFQAIPKLSTEFKHIPNVSQLSFYKSDLDFSEKAIKIDVYYGCFGYYLIRKKEYQ